MVAEEPKFLSLGDEQLLEEDEERNRKQAKRNRGIRALLERRRDAAPVESKPVAFGEVEHIASAASSPPSGGEGAGENGDELSPPPWLALRDEPSVNLRLHEELIDFANFMMPSPTELDARQAWAARIEAAAKETLGDSCQVHLFGSTSTGLNLPSADIDVAVAGVEGVRATTAMKRIAEWLLQKGEVSKIEIVQSARVPVAKLQQRSTGLWADVIINRLDGLETSGFIREHMEIFPALQPLVLFLKLFLLQRGLHETFGGGLGSYLLVCLVLSFLQRHPSSRNPQTYPKTTLGNLLFDLFRHYGQEFRYGSVGISLLGGGSLFDRVARGFTATTRTGQATLCLESPTEAGVDIGARCFKIGVIRAAFNHAYHSLSKLFLTKEVPGPSLLCPMLVNDKHEVVRNRYQLMKEQPPPLIDLPEIPDSDDEEADASNSKRRKLNDGASAEEVLLDEAARAQMEFDMMMSPVEGGEVAPEAPTGMLQVEEAELQMVEELVEESGYVCACGEILPPNVKFCSECGKQRPAQTSSLAAAAIDAYSAVEAAVDDGLEEDDDAPEDDVAAEPEPPKDVFSIVAQDEHDLDEAGIFLEAMAEVEAISRMRTPSLGSGSPVDIGLVEPVFAGEVYSAPEEVLAEEIALTEEFGFAEDVSETAGFMEFGAEEVQVDAVDSFGEDFVAF